MSLAPGTPAAYVIAFLAQIIGPRAAAVFGVILGWTTFVCFLCTVVCAVWAPPPAGSKLAKLHQVLSYGAGAFKFLRSAYQPGRTAIMAPVEVVGAERSALAEKLGIPREQTKP